MALILTALLLVHFYRGYAARQYDEHVTLHFEELVSASKLLPDGSYQLAFDPSDPRYHDLYSGWYWEVKQSGKSLKRSPSLGEQQLELGAFGSSNNVAIHEIFGPVHEKLRLHVLEKELNPGREPLVFLASVPMAGISDDVRGFSYRVLVSFLLLGFGLLLAVVLQVRVALKPLQAIGAGIGDVKEGKTGKLTGDYPADVQPLVDELNNLIEHNAVLLKRARNRLGDLAHSVKNPLTVINNEARQMQVEQKELILQQTSDISKSVDHYLSRARMFGTEKVLGARSEASTVIEDLVYAMQRIHQQRNLQIDVSRVQQCGFRGEAQDLEEMVGNLLDNACKWAISRVSIDCQVYKDRFKLIIEDDGPGISEDKLASVLQRGHKLDFSKPGHGHGLGIVKDIAELYGGTIELGRSELGGLRAELGLPAFC